MKANYKMGKERPQTANLNPLTETLLTKEGAILPASADLEAIPDAWNATVGEITAVDENGDLHDLQTWINTDYVTKDARGLDKANKRNQICVAVDGEPVVDPKSGTLLYFQREAADKWVAREGYRSVTQNFTEAKSPAEYFACAQDETDQRNKAREKGKEAYRAIQNRETATLQYKAAIANATANGQEAISMDAL